MKENNKLVNNFEINEMSNRKKITLIKSLPLDRSDKFINK